jgi:hypothetical protein
MSISIQSLSAVNASAHTTQPAQPAPKAAASQSSIPQDTVAISAAAKQAQPGNTKPAASGDLDHDADSH